MNLNLLKKLIKLATNNPNEHEANSAARRVCKLIAEADFKFVEDVINIRPQVASNPVWKPTPKQEEFFKDKGPRVYSNPVSSDWFRDMFTKARNNPYEARYNPFEDKEAERKQRQNTRRILTCKTCGNRMETLFQGLDSLFECISCAGSAYQWKGKK